MGAIIERNVEGGKEVLIQTRWKPNSDPVYSGTLEFPIGTLDKPYEHIYEALAREIDEECGLKLKSFREGARFNNTQDVFGFRPFCCTQQIKNGKPWISFIFICAVEGEHKGSSCESREIRWIDVEEMRQIFIKNPEQLFPLELPAWDYYFRQENP